MTIGTSIPSFSTLVFFRCNRNCRLSARLRASDALSQSACAVRVKAQLARGSRRNERSCERGRLNPARPNLLAEGQDARARRRIGLRQDGGQVMMMNEGEIIESANSDEIYKHPKM